MERIKIHNFYFNESEILNAVKEYIVKIKAREVRHKLCPGDHSEGYTTVDPIHTDYLGCCTSWRKMPDLVYEEIFNCVSPKDILTLHYAILERHNISSSYKRAYVTLSEIKHIIF